MTRGLGLAMLICFVAGSFIGWTASRSPPVPKAAPDHSDLTALGELPRIPSPRAEPPGSGTAAYADYRDWARREPANFLAALPDIVRAGGTATFLGDPNRGIPADTMPLRLASEANPRLALSVATETTGRLGTSLLDMALEALASVDPESALAVLDDTEDSAVRNRSLSAIAEGYARHDLEAAIDWWSKLSTPDRLQAYNVIRAVAAVDILRAIDLAPQAFDRYGASSAGTWLMAGLESSGQNPSPVADKLVSIQNTRLLADTMAWWVHRDLFGAIGWVLSQETVSSLSIERMAATLTRKDSQSALALADQFPPAVRARWIETVAETLATYDPAAARDALAWFESQPFYAQARSSVALAIANSVGPEAAAELAGKNPPIQTALAIVALWPDSPRAAEWALAIEDRQVQEAVLPRVLRAWLQLDRSAATSWAAGIPDSGHRRLLLNVLCETDPACEDR